MRPAALSSFSFSRAARRWTAPTNIDDAPLRERAVSATKQDAHVSVAVLGSDDSKRMFGADINKTNVQPLWIEVENRTSQTLWLLHSGTDPDYFSPLEVAWSMHTLLGGATNASIDDHLNKLGFRNPDSGGRNALRDSVHQPGPQIKLVNIDLFGSKTLIPFSLFVPVPDDAAGHALRADPVPVSRDGNHRLPRPCFVARRARTDAVLRHRSARDDRRGSAERDCHWHAGRHRHCNGAAQLSSRLA